MLRRITFLRWAAIVSLTAAGVGMAASLGWFHLMYTLDVTKLTVVILGLYVVGTLWCGVLSWRLDRIRSYRMSRARSYYLRQVENQSEHGWLAVGFCEKLGLTGTVVGFIIMLSGMTNGALGADSAAIQQLLARLSSGMSTAFITTLVGVVFGLLLHLQYHVLERAIKEITPLPGPVMQAPPAAQPGQKVQEGE